jgi:hypothetical protein
VSDAIYTSRPYKIGLSVAVLLFLVMLTAVIVILVIANARDERQEREFSSTITAVWSNSAATQTAVADLTGSALSGPFALPFALVPGSLTLSAGETCTSQTLSGQVLDREGGPYPGLSVMIWGSALAPVLVETAGDDAERPGTWTFTLDGTTSRHVWVQLVDGEQPLSPPVAVVFEASDCERNHAALALRQSGPTDPGS